MKPYPARLLVALIIPWMVGCSNDNPIILATSTLTPAPTGTAIPLLIDTPLPTKTMTPFPIPTLISPTETSTFTFTPTSTVIFSCEVVMRCDDNDQPVYSLALKSSTDLPGYKCSPTGVLPVKRGDSVMAQVISPDGQVIWTESLGIPPYSCSSDGDENGKTETMTGGATGTVDLDCVKKNGKIDKNCEKHNQ